MTHDPILEKPLTIRALMQATKLGHAAVKRMIEEPGFPIVAGRIFWSDFVIWRRMKMGLQNYDTASSPEPGAGHIECGLAPRSDSPAALPPRVERLRASIGLS